MTDTTGAQLAALFGGLNGASRGASVEDISGFQKQIAANDIYSQLASPVMGAQFDTSTWDPMTTIGATAAKAFLGAALQSYGQQQQGEQLAKVASVLPQLYKDPLSVAVPDGVDPQAFGGIKLNALARKAQSETNQLDKYKELLAGVEIGRLTEKAKTIGGIEGKKEAYGASGIIDPDDPSLKGADVLRKELAGNKEIIDFSEIKNKLLVLQKAMADPRTVSDLDFVYGVAKILDPASVVRESEVGLVIDSNSIPAATLGYLNKSIAGGGALDLPQRQALFDLGKRHFDVRGERVGSIIDNYSALAKKRGIATEDILPLTRNDLVIQPVLTAGIDESAIRAEAAILKAQGLTGPKLAEALRNKFRPNGAPDG